MSRSRRCSAPASTWTSTSRSPRWQRDRPLSKLGVLTQSAPSPRAHHAGAIVGAATRETNFPGVTGGTPRVSHHRSHHDPGPAAPWPPDRRAPRRRRTFELRRTGRHHRAGSTAPRPQGSP
ncbi:hypothetical protein QJS66_03590 [Kocuria rhizophila]|nr:hypothetical protein QJS66_03590 [Kocuria rhizophila]